MMSKCAMFRCKKCAAERAKNLVQAMPMQPQKSIVDPKGDTTLWTRALNRLKPTVLQAIRSTFGNTTGVS